MSNNDVKFFQTGLSRAARRTSSSRKKPLHLLQAALGREAINRITRLFGRRLGHSCISTWWEFWAERVAQKSLVPLPVQSARP